MSIDIMVHDCSSAPPTSRRRWPILQSCFPYRWIAVTGASPPRT
jgi:hypothetical protein